MARAPRVITLPAIRRALVGYRPSEVREPASDAAAVALIVAPQADDVAVLFIRRAARASDPWSGQVGLPGGRKAPEDADLLATAMRETAEEVAIDLAGAERLGTLDDVRPRSQVVPPVVVRPFVFALPAQPPSVVGTEVASVFWAPLEQLVASVARRELEIDVRGVTRRLPAYLIGADVIWGMTERILASFVTLVTRAR